MFEGKVVIVTGAGGAIGRATAQAFAVEGASVSVSDLNETLAQETVKAITDGGGVEKAIIGDVSHAKFAQFLVSETVKHFGDLIALLTMQVSSIRTIIVGEKTLFAVRLKLIFLV